MTKATHRGAAVGLLLVLAPCTNVQAGERIPPFQTDLATGENGSLLCRTPARLREAATAIADDRWLASLGCFLSLPDVPVTRIIKPTDDYVEHWTVRYMPADGPAETLFGFKFNFALRKKS